MHPVPPDNQLLRARSRTVNAKCARLDQLDSPENKDRKVRQEPPASRDSRANLPAWGRPDLQDLPGQQVNPDSQEAQDNPDSLGSQECNKASSRDRREHPVNLATQEHRENQGHQGNPVAKDRRDRKERQEGRGNQAAKVNQDLQANQGCKEAMPPTAHARHVPRCLWHEKWRRKHKYELAMKKMRVMATFY